MKEKKEKVILSINSERNSIKSSSIKDTIFKLDTTKQDSSIFNLNSNLVVNSVQTPVDTMKFAPSVAKWITDSETIPTNNLYGPSKLDSIWYKDTGIASSIKIGTNLINVENNLLTIGTPTIDNSVFNVYNPSSYAYNNSVNEVIIGNTSYKSASVLGYQEPKVTDLLSSSNAGFIIAKSSESQKLSDSLLLSSADFNDNASLDFSKVNNMFINTECINQINTVFSGSSLLKGLVSTESIYFAPETPTYFTTLQGEQLTQKVDHLTKQINGINENLYDLQATVVMYHDDSIASYKDIVFNLNALEKKDEELIQAIERLGATKERRNLIAWMYRGVSLLISNGVPLDDIMVFLGSHGII